MPLRVVLNGSMLSEQNNSTCTRPESDGIPPKQKRRERQDGVVNGMSEFWIRQVLNIKR